MSVAALPPKRDQDSDQGPDQRTTRPGWPSWIVPPVGGFKAEDLDHLPDLPRRTELRNGSLVFVSPQDLWHNRVMLYLYRVLADLAPSEWRATTEMAVRFSEDTQREPDVVIVTKAAYEADPARTFFVAEEVLLAVEVISPDSVKRDRVEKAAEYAAAGILYFWRVERDDRAAVVYAYRLSTEGRYSELGVFRDRLTLDQPFPIDIPLSDIP